MFLLKPCMIKGGSFIIEEQKILQNCVYTLVYKGKFMRKCLIYDVKLSLCDAIYIVNTQQAINKSMDIHFSHVQSLLKTGLNQNHLLPILNNTLILIRHTCTYVSS